MIGIIGAMESEIKTLISAMKNPKNETIAGASFYTGTIFNQAVVVVRCGIGKVCAGAITQILIDRYQVSEVINTGTAGGLGEQLEVGDLVIADGAIQYDFDLTPFGYVQGSLPCSGQKKSVPSIFPTDKQLSQRFLSAAQKIMKTGHCTTGFVLTGDRFVSNSEYKQWLIDTFHGSAVEMEGGAIAQVCFLNQIPFTLVRAISDLAGKEANISFDTFELMAAELSANILLTMLSESENK